ncbi:MAG: hypothetical protein WDM77_01800 [Steroidobacteraceae bacterium]
MPAESHNRTRRWLTAGLTAFAACGTLADASASFAVFDGLANRGKPDLRKLGLVPLTWVGDIWRSGSAHEELDEDGIVLALRQLPRSTQSFYLDIEAWPVLRQAPEARDRNIQKLLQVADLAREQVPGAKFGFYGLPPAITYWPLVKDSPAEYADWTESNRLLEPLAERVDFIFPSLYTFYRDREGWLKYANATIDAARRFEKPVYPFIWYEYHDSNLLLRNREIDREAWAEQLRFCHTHADGVVLWGGYDRDWHESASWWQSVRNEFGVRP